MIHGGDRHRLAPQTLARADVAGQIVRQQLDRDLTIEPWIASAIHHAHAALTEAVEDFIRAEVRAGIERQAMLILS
jgi:hypothetical protein